MQQLTKVVQDARLGGQMLQRQLNADMLHDAVEGMRDGVLQVKSGVQLTVDIGGRIQNVAEKASGCGCVAD